jgi:hypothetical protein
MIDMVGFVDPVRTASRMAFLPTRFTAALFPKTPLMRSLAEAVGGGWLGAIGAVGVKTSLKLFDFLDSLRQHRLKFGDPAEGGAIAVHGAFHEQVKYA